MKRLVAYLTAIVLLTICLIPAAATETTGPTESTGTEPPSDSCGDAIVWSFSGGVLTLTGTGRMYDFFEGPPWAEYKSEITTVVLSGSITYVGAYAFYNYDSLVSVNLGGSLEEIGQGAFYSCDGLTSVTLPLSFICFGPESFMSCRNLKTFYCNGYCPSFRLNCLRETYSTIYYPATRPWPLEDLIELEEAFHGRIEFLASDGTDPIPGKPGVAPPPANPPTDPPATEPPAETPTEEPTEEPTTEEVTEPTEKVTEPTEKVTEPTEKVTEPTEKATEPTEETPEEASTEPPTEEVTEEATTATESPSTEAPAVPSTELTRSTNLLLPGILSCAAALLIPVILLFTSIRKRNKGA